MKKYIVILIVLFGIVDNYGQAPGYLGKRLNLSYSGLVSPNVFHYDEAGVNFLNYTHALNIEWVLSRKRSIAFKVQSFAVRGYLDERSSNFINQNLSAYENNQITDEYDLNVFAFSFDYIFYKDDWIAPLGRYSKIGLMYLQYSSTNYLTQNETLINLEDKVTDYAIAVTFTKGKRWIFRDLYTLHIASQFGFVIPTYLVNGSKTNNYFAYESESRLFSYMMYNFEVGVGLLF